MLHETNFYPKDFPDAFLKAQVLLILLTEEEKGG